MKFGRYLAENATPEWKRAYIDYRAAKKAIKRVANRLKQTPEPIPGNESNKSDDGDVSGASSSGDDDDHGPSKPRRGASARSPAVPPASTALVPRGVLGPWTPPAAAGTPPAPSQAASMSASHPASQASPLHAGTPSTRRATPKVSAKRSPGSRNYGAMGTSPPLTEDTTPPSGSGGLAAGFSYNLPERHHSRRDRDRDRAPQAPAVPPPLDLGEPSLEAAVPAGPAVPSPLAPPGTGTDTETEAVSGSATATAGNTDTVSSGATLVTDGDWTPPYGRDRKFRNARSPRMQVDFSPVVAAIPGSGLGSTNAMADDGQKPKQKQDITEAEGDDSVAELPANVPAPMSPRKRSALSPLLSRITSRVQATAGVSPSGIADAPSGNRSIKSLRLPSPRIQPYMPRTIDELYDTLQPDEQAFFDLLDHELEKVETFYTQREVEATRQAQQLRDQMRDLSEHRRVFHEAFPEGVPEWEAAMSLMLPVKSQKPVMRAVFRRQGYTAPTDDDQHLAPTDSAPGSVQPPSPAGSAELRNHAEEQARLAKQYDPDRYQKAKKELRRAMLEFYRHLELIKNYRILNLTGFRKALKKFEKTTHIQCLELYTEDRITPCSFSRGDTIDTLLQQTEDLFTEHFEHGNKKKARTKLRQQDQPVTHYFTVFRSGTMIGLGLPAAVLAIVKSFDPETRAALPAYQALLQIYAALYMPVIFSMLFELDLQAWIDVRINYEFVMELNYPVLDARSYLEIPAFFFLTLSYCFFFSFYRVATHSVAPTTWPAAWLVFVAVFFLNPLPVLRRRSRWWLIKVLWRVCTPGYSRVEFIAFFVADLLNSLVYSIQSIYFLSCVYGNHWPDDAYGVCPNGKSWPYALLACLPPLARLIQCLKRFKDSNMQIHLVNAGKYCSSILQTCLFVYWRSQGSPRAHASFVVWIIFATLASIYTSLWDLIVDWALLRPHNRLLRPDLLFGHPAYYYFAAVTNILIRFIWVWYLPVRNQHTHMRSWIFALLEMLRRTQWALYRVETEHQGNSDAYRATRLVPLPYIQQSEYYDVDADGTDPKGSVKVAAHSDTLRKKLSKIRQRLVGDNPRGRGPDALNVGARGHAAQREYEARRPGDDSRSANSDSSSFV